MQLIQGDIMETPFGKYLRSARVAAGRSLREVASEVGVTHVYLGEVERGVRGPVKRERWESLLRAIPGLQADELERLAATSRSVKIDVRNADRDVQELALLLARRIEQNSVRRDEAVKLLRILRGGHDDDE